MQQCNHHKRLPSMLGEHGSDPFHKPLQLLQEPVHVKLVGVRVLTSEVRGEPQAPHLRVGAATLRPQEQGVLVVEG